MTTWMMMMIKGIRGCIKETKHQVSCNKGSIFSSYSLSHFTSRNRNALLPSGLFPFVWTFLVVTQSVCFSPLLLSSFLPFYRCSSSCR